VIHAKFHQEFSGYTGEMSIGMGKESKTKEEEENNAPVVDIEAKTSIHGGGGQTNDWGEEDT
jgi:hypothetical protein